LPDGRVAYRLRKARKRGATHLVLSPVHFLARLAAIVPPPRYPLVRFAGVLAPGSTWRGLVVPGEGRAKLALVPPMKKRKKKKGAAPVVTIDSPKPARTSLGSVVGARIDWASLLERTFLEDVLACPCGGRRRILAEVNEPEAIVASLAHLGMPTGPPPIARARAASFDAA
jgi:hypothetical protein